MKNQIDKLNTLDIKISLLSKGINVDENLFVDYPLPFYDNQFVYGQTSKNITPTHKFPQVILLGEGVNCALLRREKSPWSLKRNGEKIWLEYENNYVRDIYLPERPKYFDKELTDGTPTQNIIAVAGEITPGFFFYPECYYFNKGIPCQFCSMKGTRSTVGKHMISKFSDRQIEESIHIIENTQWRDFTIYSVTTGTCETDEEIMREIIHPISIMSEAMKNKKGIHLLTPPPQDLNMLEEYKKAGVTSIAFNLEAYSKKYFELRCPGKTQQYGYDKWIKSLKEAVAVFGNYKVFCGLVWGIEPIEYTKEGHEYMAENKIALASNVFHSDNRCIMREHPHPSEKEIYDIADFSKTLFEKNKDMDTIFDISMRSTIDWEVRNGLLNNESIFRNESL